VRVGHKVLHAALTTPSLLYSYLTLSCLALLYSSTERWQQPILIEVEQTLPLSKRAGATSKQGGKPGINPKKRNEALTHGSKENLGH
jgi:hypothetical protein